MRDNICSTLANQTKFAMMLLVTIIIKKKIGVITMAGKANGLSLTKVMPNANATAGKKKAIANKAAATARTAAKKAENAKKKAAKTAAKAAK